MKLGLQSKLLLPTLTAVILSMGAASFFSYRNASEEIWSGLVSSSHNIVDSVSKGLTTYVEDIKAVTGSQSRTNRVKEVFLSQDPSPEIRQAAVAAMAELTAFSPSIQSASLLNTQGDIILSLEPGASGNFSERAYFKRAMQGEANVSEPLMSKVTGKPVVIVAAPVKIDEKVAGVLYARVDLGAFTEEMIDPVRIGRTGYAFLLDKSGMVFSHPDKERILKQNVFEQDWGKRIRDQDKGVVDYASDKGAATAIFTKNKATGWTVAVVVPGADIAASLKSLRNASLLFSAAGVALVSLIIFLIVRRMINDLAAAVDFAGAVASGDLGKDLTVTRSDEVGRLSDSLTVMVGRLKEMIETSNAKTREAEEQTDLARQATEQAEQARREAERAKAEGMLHAANKLEGVVEVVSSASEELSSQIEQSSRGAEEQSRRVVETATAMEEMNATVLEVAKSASHAAETAERAKAKAEEGSKVVGMVVTGIQEVRDQAQEMMTDMGTLGKQAEGIGQIMNVISDIADQTNLLALNAAIEAARAGEAGRGFAVVADEVRKLAEKTMTATKEVGDAIRGIQDGTRKNIANVERSGKTIEEATVMANKSGEALAEIVSLVDSTTDQVRSIATASEEQSAASEEINHSIEDVNRISSETADAMRESSKAVTELANQAQVLKTLIVEMQAEGGTERTGPGSAMKALS